ncbi:hypothetical protein [Actinospongicola halichondriae]|uniref:hypothetical protein n=1 Tax=Actinospongicola halichondriae TaxID=3236844 RepID=UPI003D3EA057
MTPGSAIADVAGRHPRPAALAGVTVTAIVVRGTIGGDERAWPYLLVYVVLLAVAALTAAGGRLSGRVVWSLSILGAVHVTCGLAVAPGTTDVSLYEHWLVDGSLKLDQVVHAGGTAVLTVAASQVLVGWFRPGPATHRARWCTAGLVAVGLGACNEVFEFAMALRIESLRIGDAANTGWDLAFNLAGAAAVVLCCSLAGPPVSRVAVSSASTSGRSVG